MIMKNCLLLIIFSPLFIFCQSNNYSITIKVASKAIAVGDTIFITGNNNQFGMWQPDEVPLNKNGDFWERAFQFPANSNLEFKFTKGSWLFEALDENRKISENNYLTVTKDSILTFNIYYWNDGAAEIDFEGQITGNVVFHQNMKYKNLLPRDISVWLPPGYEENKTKRYPVLYMHDGQNIFDPSTSYTKIDWQIDEAADSLIRNGCITPIIVVGINNTKNRTAEYTPGPISKDYMEFIVSKLKPFIDNNYRTLPDRNNTAVGGSSAGGTISFMLLWEYNNIFSKAACFSPAFIVPEFNYVNKIKQSGIKKDFLLYLYNGGIGLEVQLQYGYDLLINKLENFGYKENVNFFSAIDSSAVHNEKAWAKQFPNMLKTLYGK